MRRRGGREGYLKKEVFPLKIQFKPTPGQQEPILTLSAQRLTPELEALLRRLERECPPPISGWQGDRVTPLEHYDLLRCYTAGQKVLAQTLDGQEYTLRLRLYELEELLSPSRFARISNGEIVNLKAVTALDLSLTGTIQMTLTGGVVTYVSRRYVKKIKQTLNLERRRMG